MWKIDKATKAKTFRLDAQRQFRLIEASRMLGVSALYALLIHMEHRFFPGSTIAAPLEASGGFALAVLLIGGNQYIWSVFFGGILINAVTNPWGAAVVISMGHALEAVTAAWLLTRNHRLDLPIRSFQDFLRLFLLGGVAAIGVGAIAAVAALLLIGFITPALFFQTLGHWWMGGMLGVILVTPLILAIFKAKSDRSSAKRVTEAALLFGLMFLAGQIIFFEWFDNLFELLKPIAKAYWMFLFVALIAYRFGTRGAVIGINLAAIQALLSAYQRTGYFADDIAQTHLVGYSLYVTILSLIGMVMATHFSERKMTEVALSSVLENSPDNIIRYDLDCRATYANPMAEKTLGIKIADIIGKKPSERIINGVSMADMEDAVKYQKTLQQVIGSGVLDNSLR